MKAEKMNAKKTLIIAVIMMLAVLPAIGLIDDSGSDATISIDGNVTQGTITSDSGGDIYIKLESTEDEDVDITITVTNSNTGDTVGETTVTIPANEDITASVHVNFGSAGTYNAKITCTPSTYFENVNYTTATITVTDSIWSNWTSYAAIIVVVLLVVIALVLHMRSAPKIKPDTTFTQLEEQQKEPASKSGESAQHSTTRKKYKSSEASKPSEEAPVKSEPKKAQNFTELEKQKKSSESDESEPKKLKYVSSRRK